jgi:hypothetical protein
MKWLTGGGSWAFLIFGVPEVSRAGCGSYCGALFPGLVECRAQDGDFPVCWAYPVGCT